MMKDCERHLIEMIEYIRAKHEKELAPLLAELRRRRDLSIGEKALSMGDFAVWNAARNVAPPVKLEKEPCPECTRLRTSLVKIKNHALMIRLTARKLGAVIDTRISMIIKESETK